MICNSLLTPYSNSVAVVTKRLSMQVVAPATCARKALLHEGQPFLERYLREKAHSQEHGHDELATVYAEQGRHRSDQDGPHRHARPPVPPHHVALQHDGAGQSFLDGAQGVISALLPPANTIQRGGD